MMWTARNSRAADAKPSADDTKADSLSDSSNHRIIPHALLDTGDGIDDRKTVSDLVQCFPKQRVGNRLYLLVCDESSRGDSGCFVVLLVACFITSQRVYLRDGSDQAFFTCCHVEIEVADPTFRLTQSQYTDTGPTSPSADPITPGAWQGSHWSANF